MNGNDLSKQFDALKRQVTDLVRDLHARKLAVPAAAILAAIVAAMVLLPKDPTPPPAPPTASLTPVVKEKVQVAAQISTIKPTPLGDDIPLASSSNPFSGETGYSCKTIKSNPKTLECDVSGLKVVVMCDENAAGPCAASAGSTASTGGATGGGGSADKGSGTGTDTGGGSTGGGGGDSGSGGSGDIRYFYYAATMKLDDTTYKKVPAGTMIPRSSNPMVAFLGESADGSSGGTFLAANGVTVSGVAIDPIFNSFALEVGQTVTLTDAGGKDHKFTLKSIELVEQK